MDFSGPICNPFKKFSWFVGSSCKHIWEEHRTALVVTAAAVTAYKFHQVIKRRKLREEWNSAGENIVVLHTIPSATTLPNLSPFILKLETYMRMAEIQYKRDLNQPFGPKGKFPWITLNGEDYADSELIVEFLGNKFKKDFSSHFSEEQKAIARAMLIMNDEHMIWGLIWWRFVGDPDFRAGDLMKLPFSLKLGRRYKKYLWAQGLGRHTDEELIEIMRKDIEAISLYLGQKKFLMGDTPCEVDCSAFAMLSQFVWGTPGSPFAAMLQSDYRKLQNYCFRMKEKFWPDWDKTLAVYD